MNEFFEWREAPKADFAVIGDPVAHSLSPRMHNAAFAALRLPLRYIAVRVPPGEVLKALDHLAAIGFRGVNVTVPHKKEAAGWALEDGWSNRSGVVNTVNLASKLAIGTDGPGFLDTLSELGLHAPSDVLILGAGGSARALAAALPEIGFKVKIWNRTFERAEALAKEFNLKAVQVPTPDVDLIVNTTSAGLQGDSIPLDWGLARPGAIAYDLVYGETPFLRQAAEHGLQTVDGKPLLVAQGARSFEWWLGITAPRVVMMEAIQ